MFINHNNNYNLAYGRLVKTPSKPFPKNHENPLQIKQMSNQNKQIFVTLTPPELQIARLVQSYLEIHFKSKCPTWLVYS